MRPHHCVDIGVAGATGRNAKQLPVGREPYELRPGAPVVTADDVGRVQHHGVQPFRNSARDLLLGGGFRPLIVEDVFAELWRGFIKGLGLHAVDAGRGGMDEFLGSLGERRRNHVACALDIGPPLPLSMARP